MTVAPFAVLLRIDRSVARHTRHPRHLHPALDLKYVQAGIESRLGAAAPLLDGWLEPFDAAGFAARALTLAPRVAVIRAVTWCLEESVAVAKILRRAGVIAIAVGQQVQHAARVPPPDWLAAYDLAVPGEPEEALPELVAQLAAGHELATLQRRWPPHGRSGLAQVSDPGCLPQPRFSPAELAAYPFPFPVRGAAPGRWAYVLTAWGCPRPCQHCTAIVRKSVGRPLRPRPVAQVLDEIEGLAAAGAEAIAFEDDSLFVHRQRFLELADGLRRRGVKLPWMANARPDELDAERIAAALESGAVLLKVGVDTGSPRLIEHIGKAADGAAWMAASRSAFRELKAQGIGSVSLFMLGLPGETRAESAATLDLALELPADYLQVQLYEPYPDVGWWESFPAGVRGAADYHYARDGGALSELSRDELAAQQQRLYRRFYFRPAFIARHLRHGWRHYLRRCAPSPARVVAALRFLAGGA